MTSFFIQNFGCRVNQAEAFAWAQELQHAGLTLADDWRAADLIVINSCTLTHRADRDVRKFIQKAARECPASRIVVTGCYVEREPEAIAAMHGVAGVFRNGEKPGLVREILGSLGEEILSSSPGASVPAPPDGLCRERTLQTDRPDGHCEERSDEATSIPVLKRRGGMRALADPEEGLTESAPADEASLRARALVKVQDGCNNRCTFCVIPSVRGRSVSFPAEEIVASVADLSTRGYREIVLAGIHLSSWGEDLDPRQSLADLLRRIEAVEGLGRLRLSSLDPRRMDDDFITYIAGNPKICQHFHLSLQHASDRILIKMGRGGSLSIAGPKAEGRIGGSPEGGIRGEKGEARANPEISSADDGSAAGAEGRSGPVTAYASLLRGLRERSPQAAIGADIIVGFPGETDEDFEVLEDFLRRSPLTYFHVFSYSPRRGTPAAGWKQVPEPVKKARSQALRRLSAEKNPSFRQSLLGRELDAVVIRRYARGGSSLLRPDGHCEERSDETTLSSACVITEALTGNYVKIMIPRCSAPERELVRVRITRVAPRLTEGEIVG